MGELTALDHAVYALCDYIPIMICHRGSIAHGLYIPSDDPGSIDDIDYLAIIIPEERYYFGLSEWGSRGTKERFEGPIDLVQYEVRKYLSLLARGNPNVLASLWLEDKHYIHATDEFYEIKDSRSLFMTQRIYDAFIGYAVGQLYKMEHMAFQGYMGEKRKGLVQKHGYDTKNAAHCIRLLRMGLECASTGELIVDRSKVDGDELLAIKRGEYSLERIKEMAQAGLSALRSAESAKHQVLPKDPDQDAIERLCMKVVRSRIG